MSGKAIIKASGTMSLVKVNMNSPQALANFAVTLKAYIVANDLYVDVKGNNYVLVEGWQFAGGCIGIFPIVKSLERIEAQNEIRYKCEVTLEKSGKVVGSGFAICSSKEAKRASNDEYVIASMAQTRAIGKAYRNQLGWLMKLAGFKATPAEEMDEQTTSNEEVEVVDPAAAKAKVTAAFMTMSTIERIKYLKKYGKASEKNLTDYDYTALARDLEEAKQDESSNS